MNAVVLTSENAQDFYAEKLGLKAEPPAAPAPDAAKAAEGEAKPDAESPDPANTETSSAKEAAEQQAESDPEKKQKLNLRFSELSQRIKDAEAKAEAEKSGRELAEKRAKELEARLNPPAQAAPDAPEPEPKPEQFKDAFEYAKALAEWSADNALRKRDVEEAEKQSKAEQDRVVETFRARAATFKAATPDYDAVIAASNVTVGDEIRQAILDSDVGPQLLYHFAQNPADADRLRTMKLGPALRELGKLEAKMPSAKAPGPAEAPASKPAAAATEISRAPAPINPLKGSGSAVEGASIDSAGVFHGSYADWKAQRKAGKIK